MMKENLAEQIVWLDCFLTGASHHDAKHTNKNSIITHNLENFLEGDCYYLSDGGYSRIYLNFDGKLCIDSVSTDKAKKNWEHAIELIRDIEFTAKSISETAHDKTPKNPN